MPRVAINVPSATCCNSHHSAPCRYGVYGQFTVTAFGIYHGLIKLDLGVISSWEDLVREFHKSPPRWVRNAVVYLWERAYSISQHTE